MAKNPNQLKSELHKRIGTEWKELETKRKKIYVEQANRKMDERRRLIEEFNKIKKLKKPKNAYNRYLCKMYPIF